jgi:hypothetical protein
MALLEEITQALLDLSDEEDDIETDEEFEARYNFMKVVHGTEINRSADAITVR